MSNATTLSDTKLTIVRTLKAPVEKVFDAWTNPSHLKNWWRCDPAWTTEIAEVDLQVGGRYRLGMKDPTKDHPHVCVGTFKEIDAPNRLVYSWQWEDPTEHPGESLVTVEFKAHDDGTQVVITHEGFTGPPATEAHQQGWTACLGMFEQLCDSN